tara:strand:+ start:460 stop:663 length:204 start_codon:yes stop_codon:yes gene_type:complete
MTALARIESFAPMTTEAGQTSMMNGSGLEMFTTGLAPHSTDMMAGDGVDMFAGNRVSASKNALNRDL